MPKAKLKIDAHDAKKLQVAAHYADVKLEGFNLLGKSIIGVASCRNIAQLVDLGRYLETVSGNELDTKEPTVKKDEKTQTKK